MLLRACEQGDQKAWAGFDGCAEAGAGAKQGVIPEAVEEAGHGGVVFAVGPAIRVRGDGGQGMGEKGEGNAEGRRGLIVEDNVKI